jgi:hypothetical protein
VYQGQKVSESEFFGRGAARLVNRRGQKALFGRGAHLIFKPTARSKGHDWKNYKFILYLPFSNR